LKSAIDGTMQVIDFVCFSEDRDSLGVQH